MDNDLLTIFENVNGWLKFAEQENGALFAANLALAFGYVNIPTGFVCFSAGVGIVFQVAAIGFILSAAVCLTSFLPKLKADLPAYSWNTSPNDNLVFFGDISKYSLGEYTKRMTEIFKRESSSWGDAEHYYLHEILVNSQIAMRKYRFFRVAAWMTIGALLVPLVLCAICAVHALLVPPRA